MLKFAGQVALFVLCFWVGALGMSFWVFALVRNGEAAAGLGGMTFMFLIFAGIEILGFAIGYAASAFSGRGPMISVVVGVVAGCLTLLMSYHHPKPATLWQYSLFNAGMVALAASLGGFLHQWLSRRREAQEATSDCVG